MRNWSFLTRRVKRENEGKKRRTMKISVVERNIEISDVQRASSPRVSILKTNNYIVALKLIRLKSVDSSTMDGQRVVIWRRIKTDG